MFPFMFKKSRDGNEEIHVFVDGKMHPISSTSPHYIHVKQGIKDNDEAKVRQFVNLPKAIADFTHGRVSIYGNDVYYDGAKIHGKLAENFIVTHKAGMPMLPVVNFLEKCKENPDQNAVAELYEFISKDNDFVITEDGDFLAYKRIRRDYTDMHTGTMDNSVGKIVSMDRANCDPSRHNTCSRGLHFCSRGYLGSFGGDRLVIVKVNPKNVTAIPSDYNESKGRACEYLIYKEIENPDEKPKGYHDTRGNVGNDAKAIDLEDFYEGFEGDADEWPDDDDFADTYVEPTADEPVVAPKVNNIPSNALSPALRKKIFEAISAYPAGTGITEVSKRFNVSRRTVGRIRDNGV